MKKQPTDFPTKSGMYFCEIERERMDKKTISKAVLWYVSDVKRWLTDNTSDTLVAWYDDGEEDQKTLWDEVLNIFFASDAGHFEMLFEFKSKYQIYRK